PRHCDYWRLRDSSFHKGPEQPGSVFLRKFGRRVLDWSEARPFGHIASGDHPLHPLPDPMPGTPAPDGRRLERFDRDCGRNFPMFDSRRYGDRQLELSHTEDAVVGKPAFHHIYQLVITVWIGWQQKEPRVNQVANGVVHDPLHNFAIEKLNPHPDPMDNGCL